MQRVQLAVRGGVEEVVLSDAKHAHHLLVEGGHHARFGRALGHAHEAVDVLGGAEGLLPELEVDGRVELLEARVEVTLERVGVVEVDRVRLVRVFLRRSEVRAERLGQTTELGLALVREAERKRLVRDGLATVSTTADSTSGDVPGTKSPIERCCGGYRAPCGTPPRGIVARA